MKLLLVSSHFYPENFKSNDMAFELKRRGHDVTVLAPIPDYPQGRYYDGYGIFRRRKEVVNGVKVLRTFVTPRRDGSAKWLSLNYLTHTIFSSLRGIWLGLTGKYDAIIVHESSPIMIGIPAVLIKKMKRIPLHFWVLDLWPESLSATGAITNKKILDIFGKLSKWIYRHSDNILISSKGFRASINRFGDFNSRIHYFPNWVDSSLLTTSDNIRHGLPPFPDGFNIVAAGNMGEAQDLPHVLNAMKRLKGQPINLIFVGDGRKKDFVMDFVKKNGLEKQVYCLGRYPLETMPYFFSRADVLFLALKNSPIFALTAPARLQAYMSAEKPVVAMINGDGADLIKEANCGWSVPAEDSDALANLWERLSKTDKEILRQKGNNGKRFSEENFKFTLCMDNLERIINNNHRIK